MTLSKSRVKEERHPQIFMPSVLGFTSFTTLPPYESDNALFIMYEPIGNA
jgi:hypothetical protein